MVRRFSHSPCRDGSVSLHGGLNSETTPDLSYSLATVDNNIVDFQAPLIGAIVTGGSVHFGTRPSVNKSESYLSASGNTVKISSDVVDMFYVAGGYIYGSTLPTDHLKIENNTVELSGNVTIGGVVIGGVHGYDLYYYDFGLEFFDNNTITAEGTVTVKTHQFKDNYPEQALMGYNQLKLTINELNKEKAV